MQSNIDLVLGMLSELGYEAQAMRVSSASAGTCQARVRLFIFGFYINAPYWSIRSSEEWDKVFSRILSRLDRLNIQAPRLRDCILPNDHPSVLAALEKGRKVASQRKQDAAGAKWKEDERNVCSAHPQLRYGKVLQSASAATRASEHFQVLTERDQHQIAAMTFLYGQHVAVDTSQSLDLHIVVPAPTESLLCLLPGADWWVSFPAEGPENPSVERQLLGREHLAIQGYNVCHANLEDVSENLTKAPAGNAFCGACIAQASSTNKCNVM